MARHNKYEEVKDQGERQRIAEELLNSPRGQYVLGEVVWHGLKAMKAKEYPAWSDINDVELMAEYFFPMFRMFDGFAEALQRKEDAEANGILERHRTQ